MMDENNMATQEIVWVEEDLVVSGVKGSFIQITNGSSKLSNFLGAPNEIELSSIARAVCFGAKTFSKGTVALYDEQDEFLGGLRFKKSENINAKYLVACLDELGIEGEIYD